MPGRSTAAVSVLLGNGNGTFGVKTDYATGNFPISVAIGDLNGDGKRDLALANSYAGDEGPAGSISVLLGNGDGTFGGRGDYGVGYNPRSVAIGDLNADGKPDVAVASEGSYAVSVLLGNGDGSFGVNSDYPTGTYAQSVAIGDLNGDSKPDLAVANNSSPGTVSVLLGNGDGTFGSSSNYVTGSQPSCVAIGDLNGDGKPDLAVSNGAPHTVSVCPVMATARSARKTTMAWGLSLLCCDRGSERRRETRHGGCEPLFKYGLGADQHGRR